jgi:hypothetical protein
MRAVQLSPERLAQVQQTWHGSLTRAQVAQQFRISETAVRNIWKRARLKGLLPDGVRPHFNTVPASPVNLGVGLASDSDITDADVLSEAEQSHAANVSCSDGLLLALSKHHSGSRSATLRPTDYALRCELKGQAIATPADILAACRILDLNSSN